MRMSRRMGIHNTGKSGPKIETLADVFINATAGEYVSRINSKGTLRLAPEITSNPRYIVVTNGSNWGFYKFVNTTLTRLFYNYHIDQLEYDYYSGATDLHMTNCYTGFIGLFSLPKGFDEVFVDSLFSSIVQVDSIGAGSSEKSFSFDEDVWNTAGYALAQAASGLKIYSTADYLTPLLVINEDSVCCIEKSTNSFTGKTTYRMRVNSNSNSGAYSGYGAFALFNG